MRFLGLASIVAMSLASGAASAQTTITSTATVSRGPLPYPDRWVNGANLGPSVRLPNLNPLGINYDDCLKDMTLRFTVLLSGFDGSENLEVWATNSGDCTSLESRGHGSASGATCWMVNQGLTAIVASASTPQPFDVKVRDLVGPQRTPPWPAGFGATEAKGELLGPQACTTQPSFSAVPMYVWFMPVNSAGNVVGTPYQYGNNNGFVTDLLGPPAPSGVTIADGDTLFVVNWTANADSDTAGYDVFIDPIPGKEDASAPPSVDARVLYCPGGDASTPASTSDGASVDSGDDGASDASSGAAEAGTDAGTDAGADAGTGAGMDGGCFYVNVSGPLVGAGGSKCNDPILAGGIVQDSGAVSTAVYDEAGTLIDGSVSTGGGGISAIPSQYLLAGTAGVTVSDKAARSYTISGLTNGTTYNVVVAAIDGSGNVGPPSIESPQSCDYPATVNDFWSVYRSGGGRAGGGFCALEAVGEPARSAGGIALAGVLCALVLRRRRTSR